MDWHGVVTPIGAIVTADLGQEAVNWSRAVLVSDKQSRTLFKLGKAVKIQFRMVTFLQLN